MGIRDRINKLLGGGAVSGYSPPDDDDTEATDGDAVDEEAAVEGVSADIYGNKVDAYDRIHRMPGSDTEIPH
jgi:hypothetical protein